MDLAIYRNFKIPDQHFRTIKLYVKDFNTVNNIH